MSASVTIGVPVYRGELFLEETLHSIQRQTFTDFEVIISLDGSDSTCEAICRPFLRDPRFRIVIQAERLGWVGNLNWLLSHATGEFWYYHQQDDLTAEGYLSTLVDHARRHPEAALVYCDLVPFGRIDGSFDQPPSVVGSTAFIRQMTMLHEHFPAFAFRGVTRMEAVREAGHVPTNDVDNFGVDISWLAAIALTGELHRVPRPLYRKRYHGANTESTWWAWARPRRLEAWSAHCVNMLEQALRAEGSAQEMRLLWLAAVDRLASESAAAHFLPVGELTPQERMFMFDAFVRRAQLSAREIPVLLDATWGEIWRWTEGFFWRPNDLPVDIVRFGPNPVHRGETFNMQPDGRSAIWVETSRRAAPGSRLRLNGTVLDTVVRGTLLTAYVPSHASAISMASDPISNPAAG